jgi:cobalt-zinc-cadmium resistance protein CzcA
VVVTTGAIFVNEAGLATELPCTLCAVAARMLIMGLLVALLAAGGIAFYKLNIEAYPDPVPPMVEIVTQTPGSAEEMERNVTIPIEVQMAGLPHMTAIRAISCSACRT